MKKQYICPKSEVIYIECDSLPLLATSSGPEDEDDGTPPVSDVLLDGDTFTDEQW